VSKFKKKKIKKADKNVANINLIQCATDHSGDKFITVHNFRKKKETVGSSSIIIYFQTFKILCCLMSDTYQMLSLTVIHCVQKKKHPLLFSCITLRKK